MANRTTPNATGLCEDSSGTGIQLLESRLKSVRPTPAAEYLRTSTHLQPFSVETQKHAIAEYAKSRGFVIVRTYIDNGKSGLTLNNRPGLASLLYDIAHDRADYNAVLVYDISRWGRFQDIDESAHYEFLCKALNIPVHYCAESFENDYEMPTLILKSLKRTLAAEYSRALSVSCFLGQRTIVERGFRVGATSGYGLRRMAISGDGSRKQVLHSGEYKSISTDHVVLIPGPESELKVVRHIFSRAAVEGTSYSSIARELNSLAIPYRRGRPWASYSVARIVNNPKYKGWNVWNRTSKRLGLTEKSNPPEQWVVVPHAFSPIVESSVFDRAQRDHPNGRRWSREQVSQSAEELISQPLLSVRLGPSLATLRRRLIGHPFFRSRRGTRLCCAKGNTPTRCRLVVLRNKIFDKLLELFPQELTEFHLRGKSRPLLRLANGAPVSVLVCPRAPRRTGILRWRLGPLPIESKFTTLVCLESPQRLRYLLLPGINMKGSHSVGTNSSVFKTGLRLNDLAEFYEAASAMSKSTNHCCIEEI